jgi:hydrogenase nickel incorporation protein HypB
MFRACELVVINKIDLLPHLDVAVEKLLYNVRAVNPGAQTMLVSARTGVGVDGFVDWLASLPARASAPEPVA